MPGQTNVEKIIERIKRSEAATGRFNDEMRELQTVLAALKLSVRRNIDAHKLSEVRKSLGMTEDSSN